MRPGQTVIDVGCGSGSITIEATIQTGYTGKVIGIDKDKHAVALTELNIQRFDLDNNVTIIHGDALEELGKIKEKSVDVVFIGGTGGQTADIAQMCSDKMRQGGRIVIGVILIETLYTVLQALDKLPFDSIDITQVTISKSKKTSTGTMMLARNPVTIISATKR